MLFFFFFGFSASFLSGIYIIIFFLAKGEKGEDLTLIVEKDSGLNQGSHLH